MNIRSLTRGDGVVIGAAVVLFIASFLGLSSVDCPTGVDCSGYDSPNAWDFLGLVMSMFVTGIVGAGLIVVGRGMPGRKVAGLDLGQFGVALTIFALWTSFWNIIDADNAGAGMILGLLSSIVLAGGALATPLVPALKAPSWAPRSRRSPRRTASRATPARVTATRAPSSGRTVASRVSRSRRTGARSRVSPVPVSPRRADSRGRRVRSRTVRPSGNFEAFWFAVPVARPLYGEDGSPSPIAELAPGTWYLAVEQRGPGLIAQTQDGRRGLLQDTTGIQRG